MELDCSRIVADSNEYLKLTYDVSMKEASPMKENSHTNVQDNGCTASNLKGPADGGK